jgi:hypothetical protein
MAAEKRLKIPQIVITISDGSGKAIKTRAYGPFVFKRHSDHYGESWDLKDKSHKKWGSICVAKRTENMCVTNTHLDEKLHGIGLGAKMYQHLVDYYGVLESDASGSTSDQAKKVWQRLGAKKMVAYCFGYRTTRYQLASKKNPPKEKKVWTWMTSISSMMNWLRWVSSTPKKLLLKTTSSIRFQKRPTTLWTD